MDFFKKYAIQIVVVLLLAAIIYFYFVKPKFDEKKKKKENKKPIPGKNDLADSQDTDMPVANDQVDLASEASGSEDPGVSVPTDVQDENTGATVGLGRGNVELATDNTNVSLNDIGDGVYVVGYNL